VEIVWRVKRGASQGGVYILCVCWVCVLGLWMGFVDWFVRLVCEIGRRDWTERIVGWNGGVDRLDLDIWCGDWVLRLCI
jgi:hypothetical protein